MSLSNDYKYLNQQEISCKNSINHKKELLFQSAFTWNVLKKNPENENPLKCFSTKNIEVTMYVCSTRYMEMKLNVSSFWQKPLDVNFRQQTQESCFACCVARLLLLNWNSVDKRWGAVGWFQKLCCIYLIYICRLFSFRGYFQKISSVKVHKFWEGIKILQNLHTRFDWHYIRKIYGGDFTKFCYLLRIYVLFSVTVSFFLFPCSIK